MPSHPLGNDARSCLVIDFDPGDEWAPTELFLLLCAPWNERHRNEGRAFLAASLIEKRNFFVE